MPGGRSKAIRYATRYPKLRHVPPTHEIRMGRVALSRRLLGLWLLRPSPHAKGRGLRLLAVPLLRTAAVMGYRLCEPRRETLLEVWASAREVQLLRGVRLRVSSSRRLCLQISPSWRKR